MIIVVAGATHREGMIDELEAQLAYAGIPFHVEPIEPMPAGPNSMTMRRKVDFVREMAMRFSHCRTIYIVDAFDVLFYGTCQELMEKSPRLMFAGERNSYPEADIDGRITGPTPWRYCNAGCMAGSPAQLLAWANVVSIAPNLDILDQQWLNRHLETALVTLDHQTQLFYVVSDHLEDGSLQVKEGRPYNAACNTFPNFIHFSGHCPTDQFRTMMEQK